MRWRKQVVARSTLLTTLLHICSKIPMMAHMYDTSLTATSISTATLLLLTPVSARKQTIIDPLFALTVVIYMTTLVVLFLLRQHLIQTSRFSYLRGQLSHQRVNIGGRPFSPISSGSTDTNASPETISLLSVIAPKVSSQHLERQLPDTLSCGTTTVHSISRKMSRSTMARKLRSIFAQPVKFQQHASFKITYTRLKLSTLLPVNTLTRSHRRNMRTLQPPLQTSRDSSIHVPTLLNQP